MGAFVPSRDCGISLAHVSSRGRSGNLPRTLSLHDMPPPARGPFGHGGFPICGSVSLPSCHPPIPSRLPSYGSTSHSGPTGGNRVPCLGLCSIRVARELPICRIPHSRLTREFPAQIHAMSWSGADSKLTRDSSCGPSRADDCSSRELAVSGVASPMLPYTIPKRGVGPPMAQDFTPTPHREHPFTRCHPTTYDKRVLLAQSSRQASPGSFLSSNQRHRPGPPSCPGLDRACSLHCWAWELPGPFP